MPYQLQDHNVLIEAPRELVFQMLSAMGNGSIKGSEGEGARVIERKAVDHLIVEFRTRAGGRMWRTVEEVRLYPPTRLTFHHLEGPLDHPEESFDLKEKGGATELRYRGEFDYRLRLLGWLIARFYIRPRYDQAIKDHLQHLKEAAEARAARSHVFKSKSSGGPTAA